MKKEEEEEREEEEDEEEGDIQNQMVSGSLCPLIGFVDVNYSGGSGRGG